MNSRPNKQAPTGHTEKLLRITCANPSARIILVIFVLVSLHLVTFYDWLLSTARALMRARPNDH